MKITYTKAKSITRGATYTTYAVYGNGALIGYVENQYGNWRVFSAERAYITFEYTRKEAAAKLAGE